MIAMLVAFWLGERLGTSRQLTDPITLPVDETTSEPSTTTTVREVETRTALPETIADVLRIPGEFAQATALHQLASSADEATLLRLLDEAVTIERFSERDNVVGILYRRFTEINPTLAVNDALVRRGLGE